MKNRFRVVLYPAFLLFGLVLIVTAGPAVWAELPPVAAPPKAQWGPDIRVNVVPDQATNKHNNMAMAVNPTVIWLSFELGCPCMRIGSLDTLRIPISRNGARIPLMIADQYSARMGLTCMKSKAMPAAVESMTTA